MKRIPTILLLLTAMAGCRPRTGTETAGPPDVGQKEAPTPPEPDTLFRIVPDAKGDAYFPKGQEHYYTAPLAAMGEPSLMVALPEGTERVIRFTWLPSFDDARVVRFTVRAGAVTVRSVRLDRRWDAEDYGDGDQPPRPANPVQETMMTLDPEAARELSGACAAPDFWKALNEDEDIINSSGLDGAQWIFEMRDREKYHLMNIWTPDSLIGASDQEMRNAGADPAKVRSFTIYRDAGIRLLQLGKSMPEDLY